MSRRGLFTAVGMAAVLSGCGGGGDDAATGTTSAGGSASATPVRLNGVTAIGGGRGLYVRCTGRGSPTVVMEGGDEDTSDSYAYAESDVAKVTRTCVYDRANLGKSDPAPPPRELDDYVGDLEKLFAAGRIKPPYVLVGTSGGGHLVVGYAVKHRRDIAGMVLIDTGAPLANPPREIVKATDPRSPENTEKRDYLQIERDAWAGRRRIGDIPVSIMSAKFSPAEIKDSPFPAERRAMKRNVARQRGWLVLSPRTKQIVTHGGHAVEEDDPQLVIKTIVDVVNASR